MGTEPAEVSAKRIAPRCPLSDVEPDEANVVSTAQGVRGDKGVIQVTPTRHLTGISALNADEVRIVSGTGGAKGQKLAQLGALDPLALMEVARVAGYGTRKYERFNFLRGYPWSLTMDAASRHLLLHWSGEDRDPESGLLHAAHFAWHGLTACSFLLRGVGEDDRPRA